MAVATNQAGTNNEIDRIAVEPEFSVPTFSKFELRDPSLIVSSDDSTQSLRSTDTLNSSLFNEAVTISDSFAISSVAECGDDKKVLVLDNEIAHVVEKPRLGCRRISWGEVGVRTFPLTVGDHPDANGPPLTIGWDHVSETSLPLDHFEDVRPERRRSDELRLDWIEREKILRRLGVVEKELREASNKAKEVRRQRVRTVANLQFSRIEELHQSIMRSIRRRFQPKNKLMTKY